MNRTLEVVLAFIGIGILVTTLFILTKTVIKRIPPLFIAIKSGHSRGFKDVLLLIVLILLLGLFIYDWWIFFHDMFFLLMKYL